jgi:hypothetical protein
MDIKKFKDYINENISTTVTETDIREYIREELEIIKNNLNVKISSRFPLDNNKLNIEDDAKINQIFEELVEIYSKITIENISNFEKTWITPNEKIEEGDTVYDKETDEEYFVTRFGVNNNFYDGNKFKFISLDNVLKKKNHNLY